MAPSRPSYRPDYSGGYLCSAVDDQTIGDRGDRLIAELFNGGAERMNGDDPQAPFDVVARPYAVGAEVKTMRRRPGQALKDMKPSMKHKAKARKLLEATEAGLTPGTYVVLVDDAGVASVFERPGLGEFRLDTMRHVATVDTNIGGVEWHQRWLFEQDPQAFAAAAKREAAAIRKRSTMVRSEIRSRQRAGIGAQQRGR